MKMLRDERMAGLVTLLSGIRHIGQRRKGDRKIRVLVVFFAAAELRCHADKRRQSGTKLPFAVKRIYAYWVGMGQRNFLTRRIENVRGEFSLTSLADNTSAAH